ncbi:MAG: 2-C-methyl-D-erythritol 2,4-cyclodiphosphate synthase [Candidatus Omnitrophica bacterium]|nr:2-C-methyl-D-erythritol 2,4-cyclodiphosphate synthase [Candidatus Omnitrophota bacterium]
MRIGIGYDIHRLREGRKLFLGGVEIPFAKGLEGHSDADVLLHAISDAILGAANAFDIGRHFPDTDKRYKNISSLELLRSVGKIIADKGYSVNNVDSVVIAEEPRISPFSEQMKTLIAGALGIDKDFVSIKATTNEGVGPTGRGEAIAAHAVCLIVKRKT